MAPILPSVFATNFDEKSCAGIRADFINCLLHSSCVLRQHKTPQECLTEEKDNLPMDCQYLRKSLMHCKMGMVSTL